MPMTQQERDVISGIFDRLKGAADQPRDQEAERYIADLIARQPYAPYVMAQSLYVHEQALTNMQTRVQQLESQLAEAKKSSGGGGFLSGIFGNSAPKDEPRQMPQAGGQGNLQGYDQRYAPQQGGPNPNGPWGQPQQQAPQGGPNPSGPWAQPQQPARSGFGGGGFLGTAVTTAAGVAGGMLLANSLSSMFGGHGGAAHAADSFSSGYLGGSNDGASKYDDGYQDAQQDAQDNTASDDALRRQDAYDDGVQDAADYSSDSGGGGDDSYDL